MVVEVVQEAEGGWRGASDLASDLNVHPLLHDAGEGGEVAFPRCQHDNSLLRLWAQPFALSASHEPGGEERRCGRLAGVQGIRQRWGWRMLYIEDDTWHHERTKICNRLRLQRGDK